MAGEIIRSGKGTTTMKKDDSVPKLRKDGSPRRKPGRPVGATTALLSASKINRQQAVAVFRERQAALQFHLPADRVDRLFEVSFANGEKFIDENKFRSLVNFTFDLNMPDDHKDRIDPELLGLLDPQHYAQALPVFVEMEAKGVISAEQSASLQAEFIKSMQRAARRDVKRAETDKILGD